MKQQEQRKLTAHSSKEELLLTAYSLQLVLLARSAHD
jgi:hypothetical protein